MSRFDAWLAQWAGWVVAADVMHVPPVVRAGSVVVAAEPGPHVTDEVYADTADDVREWQAAELARLADLAASGLSPLETCRARLAELGGAGDGSGKGGPPRASGVPLADFGAGSE
ncbi:hypothetical protein [Nonomuraea bangladeshensis]|uniref:hypothetical protein n=1 Tax=Nonomuraea bangladeshensis TaxID=404385 RepID=UPI003C2AE984